MSHGWGKHERHLTIGQREQVFLVSTHEHSKIVLADSAVHHHPGSALWPHDLLYQTGHRASILAHICSRQSCQSVRLSWLLAYHKCLRNLLHCHDSPLPFRVRCDEGPARFCSTSRGSTRSCHVDCRFQHCFGSGCFPPTCANHLDLADIHKQEDGDKRHL